MSFEVSLSDVSDQSYWYETTIPDDSPFLIAAVAIPFIGSFVLLLQQDALMNRFRQSENYAEKLEIIDTQTKYLKVTIFACACAVAGAVASVFMGLALLPALTIAGYGLASGGLISCGFTFYSLIKKLAVGKEEAIRTGSFDQVERYFGIHRS